jgi:hypothetical protein
MNSVDTTYVKELIDHIELLLDVAKEKLHDINKAVDDPSFLQTALKQKERDLAKKMDEILRGQLELKRMAGK